MSEFNITIESGTSKRLPIGNKWSPKDIVVTATCGEDVSEETVEYTAKLETLENAITELEVALRHKESAQPVIEPLSVTENGTYTAPDGVDGYSPITVDVSPGISETWTFTMEDGTEVVKEVVVV